MKKKRYLTCAGLNFPATANAIKRRKAGKKLLPEEWVRVEAGVETNKIP